MGIRVIIKKNIIPGISQCPKTDLELEKTKKLNMHKYIIFLAAISLLEKFD